MHIHTSTQPSLKLGIGNYTCNWGVHIAALYESRKERDETVYGFLEQGIKDKDIQLFCTAEQSVNEFKKSFCNSSNAGREKINNKEIVNVMPASNLYYPNGTFSPWAMDIGLNNFYKSTQLNGKRNIRASADMVWALKTIPGIEHLFAYESRLNYFIPGKPWISICLYNVTKFSGEMIMNVLKTHPYTINGGIITQNPYYQIPDQWLAENAPEFLHTNN